MPIKPEELEPNDWDEDPRCQTGARRVSELDEEELRRELMATEPPREREERSTMLDDLVEPFSEPELEPLPTQPDTGKPPVVPRNVVESYVEELSPDLDDQRDTIPAPNPAIDDG